MLERDWEEYKRGRKDVCDQNVLYMYTKQLKKQIKKYKIALLILLHSKRKFHNLYFIVL